MYLTVKLEHKRDHTFLIKKQQMRFGSSAHNFITYEPCLTTCIINFENIIIVHLLNVDCSI